MKYTYSGKMITVGNSNAFTFPKEIQNKFFEITLKEVKGLRYTIDTETKTLTIEPIL